MEKALPHQARRRRFEGCRQIQHGDKDHPAAKTRPLFRRHVAVAAIVFICILSASYIELETSVETATRQRRAQNTSISRRILQTTTTNWFKAFLDGLNPEDDKESVQTRSQVGETENSFWDRFSFSPPARVVEGNDASTGEYPFFVRSLPKSFCGGTLIHRDIALTLAECGGAFLGGVTVGGIQLDGSDGAFFSVEDEVAHPDYDAETGKNNIMLVKLAQASTAAVVPLNFDAQLPLVDEVVSVIGYGREEDSAVSDILQRVNVEVYNNSFCEIPESQLCAGTEAGGPDRCLEDKGGPLLTNDKIQVGIITFERGTSCGDPKLPSIYERTSAYKSFIQKSVCELSAEPPQSCESLFVPSLTPTLSPSSRALAETLLPSLQQTVPLGENTPSSTPSIADEPTSSPGPTTDTAAPSVNPVENAPTASPGADTGAPSASPGPTTDTGAPSASPVEGGFPTANPVDGIPTGSPGDVPTENPSSTPAPTAEQPTFPPGAPTAAPATTVPGTIAPMGSQSVRPTEGPTLTPGNTLAPTQTLQPTISPTTSVPTTTAPTEFPTVPLTDAPTSSPSTGAPTRSLSPSMAPTIGMVSKKSKSKSKSKSSKSKSSKSKSSKSSKGGKGKGGKGRRRSRSSSSSRGGKGKGSRGRSSSDGYHDANDSLTSFTVIADRLFANSGASSPGTQMRGDKSPPESTFLQYLQKHLFQNTP